MIDEEGVEEVWVASGIYKPSYFEDSSFAFVMKNLVSIYGGFSGRVIIDHYVSRYGGAISMENSIVEIVSCTFSNNKSYRYAGAIYAIGGNLKISETAFSNNSGRLYAGTHYLSNFNDFSISNCVFESNGVFGSSPFYHRGGAVLAENSIGIIKNCTFLKNSSPDGAYLKITEGTTTVRNSIFWEPVGSTS